MISDKLKERVERVYFLRFIMSPLLTAAILCFFIGVALLFLYGITLVLKPPFYFLKPPFYLEITESNYLLIVLTTLIISSILMVILYALYRSKWLNLNCTDTEFQQLILEEKIDKDLSDKFLNERRKPKKSMPSSAFEGDIKEYLKHVRSINKENRKKREAALSSIDVLELVELNKELKENGYEFQKNQ